MTSRRFPPRPVGELADRSRHGSAQTRRASACHSVALSGATGNSGSVTIGSSSRSRPRTCGSSLCCIGAMCTSARRGVCAKSNQSQRTVRRALWPPPRFRSREAIRLQHRSASVRRDRSASEPSRVRQRPIGRQATAAQAPKTRCGRRDRLGMRMRSAPREMAAGEHHARAHWAAAAAG